MPPIKRKRAQSKEPIGTEIPNEFDRDWPGADVILKVDNGKGKKTSVYVNKALLAYYSPTYFKPMFFHEFQEQKKKEITIDINYEIFLNILRVLHHIDYKKNGMMLAPASEVYKVAHEFDLPLIRALLLRWGDEMTPAQVYSYKETLGIELNRADELSKMDGDNIREFLENLGSDATFTMRETVAMVRACGQPVLRDDPDVSSTPRNCSNCGHVIAEKNEDGFCQSCKETLATDFSSKWAENAVAIQLNPSAIGDEKTEEVYVVPEILAIFSPKFRKMLEKREKLVLPYSFGTMNWILNLLHHKIPLDNYLREFNPAPEDLSKIDEAARELGIVFVQAACNEKKEHPSPSDMHVIRPTAEEIDEQKLRVTYNVVTDVYKRGKETAKGFETWTYDQEHMYRKVEHEHRMAYLSRNEDEETGEITWAIDLTAVRAKSLTVQGMAGTLFQDGEFSSYLKSIEKEWHFPNSGKITLTDPLSTMYKLVAKFSGGDGEVAWQYSQLFRTPTNEKEEVQLVIEVDFA